MLCRQAGIGMSASVFRMSNLTLQLTDAVLRMNIVGGTGDLFVYIAILPLLLLNFPHPSFRKGRLIPARVTRDQVSRPKYCSAGVFLMRPREQIQFSTVRRWLIFIVTMCTISSIVNPGSFRQSKLRIQSPKLTLAMTHLDWPRLVRPVERISLVQPRMVELSIMFLLVVKAVSEDLAVPERKVGFASNCNHVQQPSLLIPHSIERSRTNISYPYRHISIELSKPHRFPSLQTDKAKLRMRGGDLEY
ncbi:uncharacterized protein BDR25DRAFT_355556 [Lindgomyces ingoldianus]|uniref:Uncharacterized protein n=1 Tax=Lindgomyces ingoldianus TaxID=673940 RepID=A0ACB6QWK1_9PLEO|nr:uncharacterized protein BDR25DRAFT_355556 [Lindgomyces ingoldianus]KAF2470452.1 hypothetical protein BDR25DRAFT_355556 [Lindgomyces ingoldianus]